MPTEAPDYSECAQGSWLSFGGLGVQSLLSLRGQASMNVRDVTGLASPANQREAAPGEFQPMEIQAIARGRPQFQRDGTVAPLTFYVAGETVTFSTAFVKSVEWDASTGERVRTSYTFVAY